MAVQAVVIKHRRGKRPAPSGFSVERDAEFTKFKAEIKKEMEQRKELKALFDKHDANKDKKLQRSELESVLTVTDSTAPSTPTNEEVDFIIKLSDRNGDGCIDL